MTFDQRIDSTLDHLEKELMMIWAIAIWVSSAAWGGVKQINFQTCSGDACIQLRSKATENVGNQGVYRLEKASLRVSRMAIDSSEIQTFKAEKGLFDSQNNRITIRNIQTSPYRRVTVDLNSGVITYTK